MKRTLFPLFALLILLCKCKPEEQKLTQEEVATFVKDMEAGAVKRRPDLITSHIILQALADRMQKEKSIKNMSGIMEGVKQGLGNSELDKSLYSTIGKTGSFEKVKTYEKNGAQRAIFRIYGENGLNYLDMELTKLEGKVGIADMFVYVSGENISRSMADIINSMMSGVSDQKAEQYAESLQAVKRLMAKGNYTQAKREFDRLPFSVKNTRIADILNIQIASNLDEETYIKEIEQFESKYIGEPSLQLTLVNLYIIKKQYDKALQGIDQLDSLINKDSFLDYYRGLITNASGDSDKAIEYYKKVTRSNPAFPDAYEQLTAHYLTKNDQQNAKLYFNKYKMMRNADESTISTYEMIYPFLKE